ncbi:hypothetical protein [Hahella ganghwensis]|uniref:hypothetical protein n=1 Tax=Hahella ganghwensis TaxID=286420 RepID=UPI00036EF5F0|nr:hypothetical protein [Hahella ganghwensis]
MDIEKKSKDVAQIYFIFSFLHVGIACVIAWNIIKYSKNIDEVISALREVAGVGVSLFILLALTIVLDVLSRKFKYLSRRARSATFGASAVLGLFIVSNTLSGFWGLYHEGVPDWHQWPYFLSPTFISVSYLYAAFVLFQLRKAMISQASGTA